MRKLSLFSFFMAILIWGPLMGQNKYQKQMQEKDEEKDIVTIIDELRYKWDEEAVKLETYEGLGDFCRVKPYRDETVELLDKIHHYDTTLYFIVVEKFNADQNKEAKATLDDIEELEKDYRTRSFLEFLHKECNSYNDIERNFGRSKGPEYQKRVDALEKEMKKYVDSITELVDVIDEHVHHLDGL